jgi:thioredoxin 1
MEELTLTAFDGDRLLRPGRVAVCFHATWCGFCLRFLPKFRARDGQLGGELALADLSDEENPLWDRFGIEVVPAILGFEDGALVWRIDSPMGVGLSERAVATMAEKLGPKPAAP